MNYKIKTLYDPGSAEPLEDRLVEAAPFFGVFDGVSGLYHPSVGWRSFDGKSGGQHVVDIAEHEMKNALAVDSAEDVLKRVNTSVSQFVQAHGLNESHDIPGTAFAVAKVTDKGVEVVQGGDAFAVWQCRDGTVGATANPNYTNESRLLEVVRSFMEKNHGDKAMMWNEYFPTLKEAKKLANKEGGYVVLNGDPQGEVFWQKKSFAPDELKTLLLVTDGLVAFEETKEEVAMAHTLLATYAKDGVSGLLARVRDTEKTGGEKRHISQAEATVLVIDFTND